MSSRTNEYREYFPGEIKNMLALSCIVGEDYSRENNAKIIYQWGHFRSN